MPEPASRGAVTANDREAATRPATRMERTKGRRSARAVTVVGDPLEFATDRVERHPGSRQRRTKSQAAVRNRRAGLGRTIVKYPLRSYWTSQLGKRSRRMHKKVRRSTSSRRPALAEGRRAEGPEVRRSEGRVHGRGLTGWKLRGETRTSGPWSLVRTRNQEPRTRDQGPRTADQGPGTRDYCSVKFTVHVMITGIGMPFSSVGVYRHCLTASSAA